MEKIKEKVAELIAKENKRFNAEYLIAPQAVSPTKDGYNFPGLICFVHGYALQLGDGIGRGKLPLNAPYLHKNWMEYEQALAVESGTALNEYQLEVYALARQLWADCYGEQAAKELPFYTMPSKTAYSWHSFTTIQCYLSSYLTRGEDYLTALVQGGYMKKPTGK